jgi:hypothetical protein
MALVNSNQVGASYQFGFLSTDAPTITGFVARAAELRYEAESFAQAQDGEGLTESIVTTKPDKRKITGTFTAYILWVFYPSEISACFNFLTRFYIVRNVGVPRKKGEFIDATLEAESYALVTA